MTPQIRDAAHDEATLLARTVLERGSHTGPGRRGLHGRASGADSLRPSRTRVATVAGQVIGFCAVLLPGPIGGCDAELDYLFVYERWQGQGVGAALVVDARRIARAFGAERIRVVAHPRLEPFYLRIGARRTGTDPADPDRPWCCPELSLRADTTSPVRELSGSVG